MNQLHYNFGKMGVIYPWGIQLRGLEDKEQGEGLFLNH